MRRASALRDAAGTQESAAAASQNVGAEGGSVSVDGRRRLDIHLDAAARRETLAADVARSLTDTPRWLPAKYFYDATGSALFQRITELPEYYLTRVERGLVHELAAPLMKELRPRDIVELGAGCDAKIRWLLDAVADSGEEVRYVPVDVDIETLAAAANALLATYPFLRVHGVIGDFERHLSRVSTTKGRRLVVFFGSTIGNLHAAARHGLLGRIRSLLRPGDRLLLGIDLVKDTAMLNAAYNDAQGITAEFNRNILNVVNRAVDGDFDPAAFRHHAFYNETAARIEMHLVTDAPQTVHLRAVDLTIELAAGESIWTESSYKFTRASTRAMLVAAGLRLERWYADRAERFALALASAEVGG